ncbi:MAG: folate-binding protein YgfZ [Kofleriaceae bacterium]|nr:folate-binding protein YgfZ [Kofleriaceae bacterium]
MIAHGPVLIDRSTWGRLRVTGGDRVRFLQGLTTVNVESLADGAHGWGAILSPKGRVLSVIDIARVGEAFLIATEPSLTEPTRALLERYAVMDDVVFEPITGPAHQLWEDPVSVWRAPIVEGNHPTDGNLRAESDPLVECMRIRAGFLRYGVDVDDDHFPFETPLEQFLDYKKGCYVGQEPVFRVHAQGNAARTLRGLVVEGDAPLAKGTQIKHASKDKAGEVTSSQPQGDGTTLALGYLHRTVWEVGGTVEIDGRKALVRELPW